MLILTMMCDNRTIGFSCHRSLRADRAKRRLPSRHHHSSSSRRVPQPSILSPPPRLCPHLLSASSLPSLPLSSTSSSLLYPPRSSILPPLHPPSFRVSRSARSASLFYVPILTGSRRRRRRSSAVTCSLAFLPLFFLCRCLRASQLSRGVPPLRPSSPPAAMNGEDAFLYFPATSESQTRNNARAELADRTST